MRPIQGFAKTAPFDRFKQVIERFHIERTDGILIVSCHEGDERNSPFFE